MKYSLLFLISLCALISHGQDFLTAQTGTYRGMLHILSPNGKCDSVILQLEVAPIAGTRRWKSTFSYLKPDGTVTMQNAYELVADTLYKDDYHFLLDEKDGLVIRETRIGNTFYGTYTIDNQTHTLLTTYNGKSVEYELAAYSNKDMHKAISEPDQDHIVWEVHSLKLLVIQKGILIKQP